MWRRVKHWGGEQHTPNTFSILGLQFNEGGWGVRDWGGGLCGLTYGDVFNKSRAALMPAHPCTRINTLFSGLHTTIGYRAD